MKNNNIIKIFLFIIIVSLLVGYFIFQDKIYNFITNKDEITWKVEKGDNQTCIMAIITIYEDDNYKYEVSDGCVANYKIVYSNGDSYSLGDAISKGKVTIDELAQKEVKVYKTKK